eukprot:gene576-620_t
MKHRDRSKIVKYLLLIAVLISTIVVTVLIWKDPLKIWLQSQLCTDSASPRPTVDESSLPVQPSPTVVIAPPVEDRNILPNEAFLSSTYKSCLGKYCLDVDYKDAMGSPITRIGLLSPEDGWTPLKDILLLLQSLSDSKTRIEVVSSSHVPPYGYGRNHGWSRIIRLADRIPLQASRMIEQENSSPLVVDERVLKQYATQVRQLTRWHCRLNHVAAHSTMLTIYVEDLIARPITEIQRLASFAGIRASDADIRNLLESKFPSFLEFLTSSSHRSSPSLKHLQTVSEETIKDELLLSKNLTEWPCRSFKELEDAGIVLQKSRYFKLAANCSLPYVKCTIRFDLREQLTR